MQAYGKKGELDMRNLAKKLSCAILFLSSSLYSVTPYYSIRSQGVNAAREIVGTTQFMYQDYDCLNGNFWAALEYTRSFQSRKIAECIFGNDIVSDPCSCAPSIVISGSQVPGRAATDWLADYFGLPNNFKSTVSFRPLIQNFVIDLNFYFGLDEWLKGLYIRIDAPITHTKWHMRMSEDVMFTTSSLGNGLYPAGYFSPSANATLLRNFTDFATGAEVPQFQPLIVDAVTSFTAPIFDYLANAKISSSPLVCAGLAELRVDVGWNWIGDCYHAGLLARFAAPAGVRPKGEFAFEPVVGNGHSWEFGAGFNAHYDFWVNEECGQKAGFYFTSYVTHLFATRQRRTFDLKNKPNSRYMLAQKLGTPVATPTLDNPPFPNVQFLNEYSPVANLTTFDVDVSVAVQGDLVAMFNYTHGGYSFDLGYNFWGRSCEKIRKNGCPSAIDSGNIWALKGDASTYGFIFDTPTPVRLAATESQATIHAGTNFPASGTTDPVAINVGQSNPNIDSPALATSSTNEVNIIPNVAFVTNLQTRSSTAPVFLSDNDVDLVGTQGLSNKLFAHFNYVWQDRDNWVPYLGVGGEVEWGMNGKGNCSSSTTTPSTATTTSTSSCNTSCSTSSNCSSNACNPCVRCSVSQWGVWLKGGVSFN